MQQWALGREARIAVKGTYFSSKMGHWLLSTPVFYMSTLQRP